MKCLFIRVDEGESETISRTNGWKHEEKSAKSASFEVEQRAEGRVGVLRVSWVNKTREQEPCVEQDATRSR